MACPCGSGLDYAACCAPLHDGQRSAQSPLELMRSRYSAYALGKGRYLVDTTLAEKRHEEDAALIEEHARHTRWLKLEIIASGEEGDTGMVEFKAYYTEGGSIGVLHERSRFLRVGGLWYYADGKLFEGKIGRNDPCPCGSGKKFKKCCE